MKRYALSLVILLLFVGPCYAQTGMRVDTSESIQSSFFPILGYGTDVGFLGGGVYNRFDYTGLSDPFRNHVQILGAVSTLGFIKFESRYEKTESFGTDIRSDLWLTFDRKTYDNYFGIGNSTGFSKNRWDNEFYYFKSINFKLEYEGHKPLYRSGQQRFDWIFGVGVEYEIPYVRQVNSKINIDRPPGMEGGFITFIKSGLMMDTRNNEFDPGSGSRIELSAKYAPGSLISDFNIWVLNTDLRKYAKLFDGITAAGRVKFRHAGGDVPYWKLSALGEKNSLRGYPRSRFMGSSSIEYNLELRTWLFDISQYRLKFGGQLFTDVGRVFTERDDLNDLFKGYKQTFGFGGTISIIDSDFIVRGDIGFSEDRAQVYIGTGYIF